MDLSIIILNYKQKGLVKQCIRGILQSNIKLDYEIIVVDNNSGDGCLEMVREYFLDDKTNAATAATLGREGKPGIKTAASEKNGGFASGNNLGIKKAEGKYIMIINPDIAVTEGVVEKLYNFLETAAAAGIVGPKLINPDGSTQFSCRRYPSYLIPIYRRTFLGRLPFARRQLDNFLMMEQDHQKNMKVDWLFGACLFIKKNFLDKVGFFDERFFMYFEDLDLCRRFWEKGYEVWYLADAEMVHYHQRLSAGSNLFFSIFSKATRIHIMSGIKYFAKYLGARLPGQR